MKWKGVVSNMPFFTWGDRGSPHWEGTVQMTDDVGLAQKMARNDFGNNGELKSWLTE